MSNNMTAKLALVKENLEQEKNKNTSKDIKVQSDTTVEVESNVNELKSSLNENNDDDELKLRLQLLENMKNKKNVASNNHNTKDDAQPCSTSVSKLESPSKVTLSRELKIVGSPVQGKKSPLKSNAPSLTVVLSGDTRNVEIDKKEKGEDSKNVEKESNIKKNVVNEKDVVNNDIVERTKNKTDKKLELSKIEKDVVGVRKNLSTSLFKLSAYMSQLQKETAGVESGLNYVEELRRQLKQTEQLVAARQAKVDNLRDVIRDSHQLIVKERLKMADIETECETKGKLIVGGDYCPPTEGADNIKRKLDQIKSTAMKVKTSGSTGKSNDRLGSGDYSSPLAHMTVSQTVQLDPHTQLCRYQLAGRCNDTSCTFQHCHK